MSNNINRKRNKDSNNNQFLNTNPINTEGEHLLTTTNSSYKNKESLLFNKKYNLTFNKINRNEFSNSSSKKYSKTRNEL